MQSYSACFCCLQTNEWVIDECSAVLNLWDRVENLVLNATHKQYVRIGITKISQKKRHTIFSLLIVPFRNIVQLKTNQKWMLAVFSPFRFKCLCAFLFSRTFSNVYTRDSHKIKPQLDDAHTKEKNNNNRITCLRARINERFLVGRANG